MVTDDHSTMFSSQWGHFDDETLTTKGPAYPHPPIIVIDSFEDYCSVTNKMIKSWRGYAKDRQDMATNGGGQFCERYVGEILPWFRGQSNANHHLTPSVARLLKKFSTLYNDINTVEQYFQERFIRFARPYLTGIQPQDIVEWNYIMRHHEVPSRLLDWTKGSLIGLFYAVHDVIENKYMIPPYQDQYDHDSAVWMLEPRRLMEMATLRIFPNGCRNIASQDSKVKALRKLYFNDYMDADDENRVWRINIDGHTQDLPYDDEIRDYPMPLIPSHISRRLESHLSRFTLHSLRSSDVKVNDDLPEKDTSLIKFAENAFIQDKSHWYLVKLIIPAAKREEIARSLRMTGVSDMNFSQDLDGLAKELKFRFHLGADDDSV